MPGASHCMTASFHGVIHIYRLAMFHGVMTSYGDMYS